MGTKRRTSTKDQPPATLARLHPTAVLAAALPTLTVVLFIVYGPALHGTLLWDDESHLTRPELQSWPGLSLIWFKIGATQQYYPVVHSAFWIEHQLWGEGYLGYHVVNVLAHATSAALLLAILKKLKIPGALLAAWVFALHPVMVESVAWMSELKNTLSLVFYLSAALMYLRFDQSRRPAHYGLALGFFALALLSKSVTATLPGAILVVLWWQRGRLSRARDLRPLLPWLLIGAASGLFTAWMERHFIGAEGGPYTLTLLQRVLLSGRVIWFYLAELFWPTHLTFIYPRWDLNALRPWDYLYLPAALGLLGAAALVSRRWRGPLAVLLFFVGSLFPVLGFFNVYPFAFSFVADHFQYLASIGIIVGVAAALALLARRLPTPWPRLGRWACLPVLLVLAALSFQQSRIYRDAETLYRATLARNPDCWLAYHNLALLLRDRGSSGEAMALVRAALRIKPDYPEAHNTLGALLASQGDLGGARQEYAEACRLLPVDAQAHANLGRVLFLQGDIPGAAGEIATALRLNANDPHAHYTQAQLLKAQGDLAGALSHYQRALELQPHWPGPLRDLSQIAASAADPAIRGQAQKLLLRFSS